MKGIKNIVGYLFIVYALIVFAITMLIVYLPILAISTLKEPARAKALHRIFRVWMGVYLPLVFCPVRRKGKDNFRKGQQYVVVLNHNSLADIPVSSPWIPGPNKTLAKVEMSKIPLFGMIYKTGSILLDRKRENSRRESFTKMAETLEQGIHLCLYPEGTRNKTDQPLQTFFDGAFITAIKTGKPVMPGLIFNTARILPVNRKFWAWPQPIQIHFLEPISTEGLTLNDVSALKEKVFRKMEAYYVANRKTS
jgi:1-acyl-sn-glycerol-3-phosphate acyltransferase